MTFPEPSVDALGTRRRLQALVRLGWSESAIARTMGCPQPRITEWLRSDRVSEATRDRVVAVYEQLSGQLPPHDTRYERMVFSRARGHGRRRGWAAPLAWDDIDDDDAPQDPKPTAEVDVIAVGFVTSGVPLPLSRLDRQAAVKQLHTLGYYDSEIAALSCVDAKTIARDREDLGLPANPTDTGSIRPHIPAYGAAA